MGFRGYWFNNSGTYRTNKYPHCYVGIVKPSGAIWGGFGKYDGTTRISYGGFGKYDGTKRVGYGGFGKYDGTVRPVWGSYGGDIVTHTVTTFAQAVDTDFRVETEWHKLEGIINGNETPLYDATGHKMENPNYVIDLYYKVIVPAVGKTAMEVFFNNGYYKRTDLSLLCEQLSGSNTFIDGYGASKGAVFGSNPTRGIMFLPSFTGSNNLPTGTVIGNTNDWWSHEFHGIDNNSYSAPFLNTFNNDSSTPHNLLLSGVVYTNTSITYSINPSFAACGIPITDTNSGIKYLMPELRSGFVMIDNLNTDRAIPYFGALYMCLDAHKI